MRAIQNYHSQNCLIMSSGFLRCRFLGCSPDLMSLHSKQPRNGLCTCLSSPLSAQSIELQNSNASSSCESFANASAPPPPSSMLVRETCKLSHSLTLCVRKDLKGASEQSNPGHTHQVYTAQTNEQRGLSSGSSYETGKEHEQ